MFKAKTTIDASAEFIVKIKAVLIALPHVQKLYFTEDGNYFLAPVEGTTAVSRAEIMGAQVSETGVAEVKAEPPAPAPVVAKEVEKPVEATDTLNF
jgi:hypothetical protein